MGASEIEHANDTNDNGATDPKLVHKRIVEILHETSCDFSQFTLRMLVRKLETSLGLKEGALASMKTDIKKWTAVEIDKLHKSKDDIEDKDTEVVKQSKKRSTSNHGSETESNASLEEEKESKPKKRKKAEKRQRKPKPTAQLRQESQDSPGLEKLKALAKGVGLLNPHTFSDLKRLHDVVEKEDYLRGKLEEAGIHWIRKYPTQAEIDGHRKEYEKQKDLEGIDPTLIVDAPRRRGSCIETQVPKPAPLESPGPDPDDSDGEFTF